MKGVIWSGSCSLPTVKVVVPSVSGLGGGVRTSAKKKKKAKSSRRRAILAAVPLTAFQIKPGDKAEAVAVRMCVAMLDSYPNATVNGPIVDFGHDFDEVIL